MIGAHLTDAALTIAHRFGELAIRVVLGWLRWFWRLSVGAKIFATGCEIVVLYLVSQHLPLSPQASRELVDAGSIGLAFLLVFGVLLASTHPH